MKAFICEKFPISLIFGKEKNSDIIEMYLKNAGINALRSIVYQDFTGFKDDFEHYFVAMINSVSEKKGHMGDEYIKVSYGMIEKELCQIFKSSIQASTGFNFSQKGLLKMLKDNDKTHLIKFISPFMIENACKKYNELYSKETKITLKFSINYERGTYIINCASENKKVNGKGKGMYLKIVRVRNNGEQIVDEGDNFKENIEEVKAALDKYTPGVYKAYMCFDKQGNMVASNGVFEEEK